MSPWVAYWARATLLLSYCVLELRLWHEWNRRLREQEAAALRARQRALIERRDPQRVEHDWFEEQHRALLRMERWNGPSS